MSKYGTEGHIQNPTQVQHEAAHDHPAGHPVHDAAAAAAAAAAADATAHNTVTGGGAVHEKTGANVAFSAEELAVQQKVASGSVGGKDGSRILLKTGRPRSEYIKARWAAGISRSQIVKEVNELRLPGTDPVAYQIIFAATKGIPQGNASAHTSAAAPDPEAEAEANEALESAALEEVGE